MMGNCPNGPPCQDLCLGQGLGQLFSEGTGGSMAGLALFCAFGGLPTHPGCELVPLFLLLPMGGGGSKE